MNSICLIRKHLKRIRRILRRKSRLLFIKRVVILLSLFLWSLSEIKRGPAIKGKNRKGGISFHFVSLAK